MTEYGRVVLVRHGECVFDACGRAAGIINTELTDTGRTQAQRCAEGLRALDLHLPSVVASPLDRALLTARVLASTLRAPLTPRWELLDRHLGALSGLRHRDLAPASDERDLSSIPEDERRPPELDASHPTMSQLQFGWDQWPQHARRPSESRADVRERVAQLWHDTITHARTTGDVVVVSHDEPLHALERLVGRSQRPYSPGEVRVLTEQSDRFTQPT